MMILKKNYGENSNEYKKEINKSSLSWMYNKPPGIIINKSNKKEFRSDLDMFKSNGKKIKLIQNKNNKCSLQFSNESIFNKRIFTSNNNNDNKTKDVKNINCFNDKTNSDNDKVAKKILKLLKKQKKRKKKKKKNMDSKRSKNKHKRRDNNDKNKDKKH